MSARKTLAACLGLALLVLALIAPAANAAFGIKPGSFTVTTKNKDGSVDLKAGSHPYEFTVGFGMNLHPGPEELPEGTLRSLIVDLPPGFAGNPLATERCRRVDFEGQLPRCPGNTQVGVARVRVVGFSEAETVIRPVYNLVPPAGVPASLGFSITEVSSFQEAGLRTGSDYGISVSDLTIPTSAEVQSVKETIWGVPYSKDHDPERECYDPATNSFTLGCGVEGPVKPFLSLPTSCSGPLKTTVRVDSLQEPGIFKEASYESLDENGHPAGLNSCERPPFKPRISAQPETTVADSPTGLAVNLEIPQNEDPEGTAAAHLKDTVVALPVGMAVNPSSADGLATCTPAQIDLHGPGPANCPDAAKIGTVSVHTPLLDHPLGGSVYLASQINNPFGTLLALYIAVNDPATGIVVKLAGKVEPDPITGQLRASFAENPQLPFERFQLQFFGGPRASLTTPPTCGTYTTTTALTPWSTPQGQTAFPSDSFNITSAPGGGRCPSSEAQMPNSPGFEAGTLSPLAGSYSPLALKLTRENGSQRLARLNLTMPPGLTGKLAGLDECSDPQIDAAKARSAPGQGAAELASPSCPKSSEVGTVTVGAGSGAPFYVTGRAYLAGPYKGAPLSLAIITPAVAGPLTSASSSCVPPST